MSLKPDMPKFSAVGVSARTIEAPGAMACAHSTSRLVSVAHPTMLGSFGLKAGTGPAGWMIVKEGGAARP